MKKLLYLFLFLQVAASIQAQQLRRYATGGGTTIDTTPLHNQIVANSAALAGKLSSQVGTITDPQDTLYTIGDSFGTLMQGTDGTPWNAQNGWFHYWYDWPHLLANFVNKPLRNMANSGQHISIFAGDSLNYGDPIMQAKYTPRPAAHPLVYYGWPNKSQHGWKVVIEEGVNDVLHLDQTDTAYFRYCYTRILDTLNAHGFFGNDIVICTVAYESPNTHGTGIVYDYNTHLYLNSVVIPQLAAKYGAIFVDTYNYELQHGREANTWSDSVHVTFLGERNIATAIVNALPQHQTINKGQALAINGTMEVSDLILHTHNVVAAPTRNYYHLGVDSSGHVALITETAEPSFLDTMQNTAGSWMMRGKLGAGDIMEPYDVGNLLVKGGGQIDWMGFTTANTTNHNGVGFSSGSGAFPGLFASMIDSSTADLKTTNPRNGSAAVNLALRPSGQLLVNQFGPSADGSKLYVNGTIGTNSKIKLDNTITPNGTDGNQTINKPSGTVNIAAGGTSVTVSNNLVAGTSIVYCVIRTADATARIRNVVPSFNSFTVNLDAAATGEISIGFIVFN